MKRHIKEREKLIEAARAAEGAAQRDCEPRVSEAVSSCPSSSSSSVVSSHQQVESSRSDVAEMTETKLLSSLPNTSVDNLSPWQHSSINGSLSVLRHHQNSPDHSPRRMHRPDPSPYHVRTIDRSPLRQQQTAAARSTVFAHCPLASGRSASIWQTGHASLQHSNGLSVADNERMDVSMDEMPLNLCTTQQLTNVDSRRRILTSESSSTQVVDEHFARSLGSDYLRLLKHPAASSSAPPPNSSLDVAPDSGADSRPAGHVSASSNVVGAVDDHFRKSLGPAWHSGPSHDYVTQPDSVDDHFARALGGDMWQRIKADHERSTSVPPYSSLRYYPT